MKFLQQSLLFLVIVCSFILSTIEASAQTRVCGGDSVVLVLNGYKQGSTLWQQSPDRINWSPASGTATNNSLSFIATGTYYYQAIVADGSCSPFYSDTELVIINPPTPIAKPATGIHSYDFTANWSSVSSPGDTSHYIYFLDVSLDPTFASFLTGYNNCQMDGDTIHSINPVGCLMTYYYRVRAFDYNCGTSANSNTIPLTTDTCYPAECTVRRTCSGNITDTRDGKIYKTVQIGSQCWMAQNLNVGKMISVSQPQTPGLDNQDTSIEKYCYNNLAAECDTFGGFYLWNEMMAYDTSRINTPGPRGICPTGWHIPTDNEWTCLEKTLGGSTIAGRKLKDTTLWLSSNSSLANNSSGFTALPAGSGANSSFINKNVSCSWGSATESNAAYAWTRFLVTNSIQSTRSSGIKAYNSFNARCVKD